MWFQQILKFGLTNGAGKFYTSLISFDLELNISFLCEDCQRNSKILKYLNHVSKIKYINSYYIFPLHSVDVLCVRICAWFIFLLSLLVIFVSFTRIFFHSLLDFILYSMPPPLNPNIPSAAFLYSQCFLIAFLHSKINRITNFHFLLQNFQLLESAQKYH